MTSAPDDKAKESGGVPCIKCGRDLYRALTERYPKSNFTFLSEALPTTAPIMDRVTITKDKLKQFNANYHELAEFAAWICGTTPREINRLHMIGFIMHLENLPTNNPNAEE